MTNILLWVRAGRGLVGGRGRGQVGGQAKEGRHKRGTLKHLLILILPSLSMLTLTLTCLTSCWTASVKALSMIEILIRRVQLKSVDVNVKMKCINFSLELTSWWRCKTSTLSSTTVLFLGGNHQLTNSRILKVFAVKYLVIPATSAPSEHIWSQASRGLTVKQNRMLEKVTSAIMFCQEKKGASAQVLCRDC